MCEGYQDKKKACNRLSLRAQRNVDADELAVKYQQEFGRAHPFALMSPSTGVFLTYPEGGTMTSKNVQDIRHRATTTPLQDYIQEKYGYTEAIMSNINLWKAHGKAKKATIKKQIHITKLVHGCLPTLERLKKFDSGQRTCPGCEVCVETRDHILKCHAVSRRTWRDTFFKALNGFHAKEDTHPLLRNLWNQAMSDWMITSEENVFRVSPILFPNDVRAVICQQNSIGRRQLINGRFSVEWSRLEDDRYARLRVQRGIDDRRSGHRWQIQLISKEWMKLWKLRNEELQGRDATTRTRSERREGERVRYAKWMHGDTI